MAEQAQAVDSGPRPIVPFLKLKPNLADRYGEGRGLSHKEGGKPSAPCVGRFEFSPCIIGRMQRVTR